MKKQYGFCRMALLLCAWLFSPAAYAEIYSGNCGLFTEITWTLDTSTGILEISGEGSMWDYSYGNDYTPWYDYRSSITTVTIEDGVTSIGDYAFFDCDGLTSVTIPNSVTSIGIRSFSNCKSLATITIGTGVTTIGTRAFSGCSGLTSITMSESLISIGNTAFWKCTGLTSITIPQSVTTISSSAFFGCSGINNFEGKFAADNGRCLIVNDTLKAFAPGELAQYAIPDGVKVIGDYAFTSFSNLSSITIPESVTVIGDGAFRACSALKSVTVYNPEPVNVGGTDKYNDAFYEVDAANCTLYVPAESVEKYKNAEGWKEFGEILPIDESSAITETQQADGHVTVYNLQGVLVLETDDAADLKTLQNGAYIVNGKKMIIAR